MGLTGLFLERNVRRDFAGILSFIVMSYILVPFQAYASLKGLLEKKERGTWIRTLKTGKITEALTKLRLGRVWREIMPRKKAKAQKKAETTIKSPESAEMKHSTDDQADSHDEKKHVFRELHANLSSVLSRKPLKGFGTIGLVLLAAMSGIILAVSILSTTVPEVSAIPSNTKWYVYADGGTSISSPGTMSETAPGDATQNLAGRTTYYWASDSTYDLSSADSGTWIFHLVYTYSDYPAGHTITVTVYWSSSRTALGTSMGSATVSVPSASPYDIPITVTAPSQSGKYIQLSYYCSAPSGKYLTMQAGSVGTYLLVPEYALLALIVTPLLPTFMKNRKTVRREIRVPMSKSCRAN